MPSLVEQIFLQAEAGQSKNVGALSRAALLGLQLGSREKLEAERLRVQADPTTLQNQLRQLQIDGNNAEALEFTANAKREVAQRQVGAAMAEATAQFTINPDLLNDENSINDAIALTATPAAFGKLAKEQRDELLGMLELNRQQKAGARRTKTVLDIGGATISLETLDPLAQRSLDIREGELDLSAEKLDFARSQQKALQDPDSLEKLTAIQNLRNSQLTGLNLQEKFVQQKTNLSSRERIQYNAEINVIEKSPILVADPVKKLRLFNNHFEKWNKIISDREASAIKELRQNNFLGEIPNIPGIDQGLEVDLQPQIKPETPNPAVNPVDPLNLF